ncbi:MAG: stage V sporulation protein AD [Eubacteriales bacterium]|nr:stage V sporulation protein AD [Eubacteriales bacterium]
MANKRIGERSLRFDTHPRIISGAEIVGELEGQGPIGGAFDTVLMDDRWGEKSYERAECRMFEEAVRTMLHKVNWETSDLDCLLGGDLLNQIVTANYAARQLGTPFLGLYGACSTMAQSMLLGAMLIDGGYARNAACAASSHFATAERQYRMPLEMGTTDPPTAQHTVTGAGALLLEETGPQTEEHPFLTYRHLHITGGTIGRVVDLGITDAANMGAAMAPAACDTIVAHVMDINQQISYYDLVVTGDLGQFGSEMLYELCREQGVDLAGRHLDCGNLIYHPQQKMNCGGSGCGCSAVVMAAHILPRMEDGNWSRVLFLATGALMSPGIVQQGETIPGIAHAVVIERD